jgi:redox-sensitive bicupin YhaK (pirin superfamily)
MSWQDCPQAECRTKLEPVDPVKFVLVPRKRDLGGFEVRRALPSGKMQAVGPFIFFDQAGPSLFEAGQGIDVRPHPHIGLATVTYLFEGELLHRDSLGNIVTIRPGDVNWMTAGRGIVHSERTPAEARERGARLHGIQAWVALPQSQEETEPAFLHYPDAELPIIEDFGVRLRLIAGSLLGETSPVKTFSQTIYADAEVRTGGAIPFEGHHEERAVYVARGEIEIGGHPYSEGTMAVLRRGNTVTLRALAQSRILILGGEALDGPRHIWWNFVSSRKERIEQAKADWQAGRFDAIPDETEAVPLPDTPGP